MANKKEGKVAHQEDHSKEKNAREEKITKPWRVFVDDGRAKPFEEEEKYYDNDSIETQNIISKNICKCL